MSIPCTISVDSSVEPDGIGALAPRTSRGAMARAADLRACNIQNGEKEHKNKSGNESGGKSKDRRGEDDKSIIYQGKKERQRGMVWEGGVAG